MQHEWIKSTLGHGETMCSRCFITNREAAALGVSDACDVPPPPPKVANDNKAVSQEEIDAEYINDDEGDDDDYDPGEECGRWQNGRLARGCSLAGTEWCDWDCPYSR
jgi:hypothetical protein